MPIDLTGQEMIVLNVVQEYLNQNRSFNMKKVLPFIISRFRMQSININNRGIEEILKSLVNKKIIVEGSKKTRSDVLVNQKRKMIYEVIQQKPGIFFNKIVEELGLYKHVAIWHLDMLVIFNFIKRKLFLDHEIYFDSSLEFKNIKRYFFLYKEKSRKIIKYLKEKDNGITKTQISRDLSMHYNTTTKYIDYLVKYDFIYTETAFNKTLYYINKTNNIFFRIKMSPL